MNSYRNPRATWRGSPNYTTNRAGHDMSQPSWIVLHTMVGTMAGADARFQQSSQQASAHYGVGLDGRLVQWVDEKDAAWTNGATGRGGVGDNLDSITLEHEDGGDYNGPRTPALYAASSALVRDVCLRYGVPIDRQHIIGHRECTYAQTSCPDALDVDRIVAAAAQEDDMTPNQAQQLEDVWNFLWLGGAKRLAPQESWLHQQLAALLAGQGAAQADLTALLAAVQGLADAGVPPANLQPVLDAVKRLSVHLGLADGVTL